MSKIEDLTKFLKKNGFSNTLQILGEFPNYQTTIRIFFTKLNEISYYNSFSRIKSEMIEKDLLRIEKINNKRMIKLTDKGISLYKKLIEINNLIKNHEV